MGMTPENEDMRETAGQDVPDNRGNSGRNNGSRDRTVGQMDGSQSENAGHNVPDSHGNSGQNNGSQDKTTGQDSTDNRGNTGRKKRGGSSTDHKGQGSSSTEHRGRGGSRPGQLAHNKTGVGLFNTADNTEPGDNARFIRFALASWDLPPVDISDPQQVKDRILQYFQHCAEHDRKPQVVGMANWLGVSRDTLQSWKRGETRKDTHSAIVQKAMVILEEMWTDYMQNGKVNPAAGIFLAKNWYGYRDVQDVVVTPQVPYESGSAEDVAARYIEGMVGTETVDGGDGRVD